MSAASFLSTLPMRPAEVTVFGGLEVKVSGTDVRIGPATKFTMAVLAIASEEGLSSRDLRDLLWETGTDSQLRGRLNQRLHDLRTSIGLRDCVVYEEGVYRLDRAQVRSDIEAAEKALQDGSLDFAAQLVTSEMLKGLDLRETPSAAKWIRERAASLRKRVERAADRAWHEAVRVGDWTAAADAAQAMAILTQYGEVSVSRLAEAIARTGGVTNAYSRLRRPDPTVPAAAAANAARSSERLAQELLRARQRAEAVRHRGMEGLDKLELFGRQQELAALVSALSCPAGGSRFIFIEGDEGTGKSRIASEALSRIAAEGQFVLAFRGTEVFRSSRWRTLVEGLSLPWVRTFIGRLSLETRRALEIALAAPSATIGRQGPSPPSPDHVRSLLEEIAAERPLIVFVDDFEHIDHVSKLVLVHVLATVDSPSISWAITARRSEPLVHRLSVARIREGCHLPFRVIPVTPLPIEDAQGLARRALSLFGGDVTTEADTGELIAHLAGRNPGRILQIVRRAVSVQSDGGADELYSELISLALEGLGNVHRHAEPVLFATSLSQVGASIQQLGEILELPAAAVADALDALSKRGLVRLDSARAHLISERFRMLLAARVPKARRTFLHSRFAEVIEPVSPSESVSVARHLRLSGNHIESQRVAFDAAHKAAERGDLALKADALRLGLSPKIPIETEILPYILQLAHTLVTLGGHDEAEQWFIKAAKVADRAGDALASLEAEIGTLTAAFGARVEFGSPGLARARSLRHRALELDARPLLERVLELELRMLARLGWYSDLRATVEALPSLGPSLPASWPSDTSLIYTLKDLFTPLGQDADGQDPTLTSALADADYDQATKAVNWLLILGIRRGTLNTLEGLQLQKRAIALKRICTQPFEQFKVVSNLGVWHLDSGDLDAAGTALAGAREIARSSALLDGATNLAVNMGSLHIEVGAFSEALGCFDEVLAGPLGGSPSPAQIYATSGRVLALAGLGRLAELRCVELPDPEHLGQLPFDASILFRARSAQALAIRGRESALEELAIGAQRLAQSFRLGWLRLGIEQLRFTSQGSPSAEEMSRFADEHALPHLKRKVLAQTRNHR